jgi:hypothetical protein
MLLREAVPSIVPRSGLGRCFWFGSLVFPQSPLAFRPDWVSFLVEPAVLHFLFRFDPRESSPGILFANMSWRIFYDSVTPVVRLTAMYFSAVLVRGMFSRKEQNEKGE